MRKNIFVALFVLTGLFSYINSAFSECIDMSVELGVGNSCNVDATKGLVLKYEDVHKCCTNCLNNENTKQPTSLNDIGIGTLNYFEIMLGNCYTLSCAENSMPNSDYTDCECDVGYSEDGGECKIRYSLFSYQYYKK